MKDYGRYEERSKRSRPYSKDSSRRGTVQPMSSQRRQGTGGSQRQDPAMRNRSSSSTERRRSGSGRSGSSYRDDRLRQETSYQSSGSRSGRRTMEEERTRMKARAKKRRRRRQRRILLGVFFLLAVFLIGGAVYGFFGHRREAKKQEFLKEGIDLLEQGSYEEAIARLDEALQWSKGRVEEFETNVLLYRAETEFRLEDYDAAMNTYKILCDSDTENEEYKKGAAYCMVKKGDYNQALALGVIDGYICNLRAVEQMNAGEYDVALEWIERGKAAGDSMQDLSLNEAVAWENKGDFARALELFEAYAAQYGTDENVEHELTFLRSRQNNGEEGVASQDSGEEEETGADQDSNSSQTGESESNSSEEGSSSASETSGTPETSGTEASSAGAAVG